MAATYDSTAIATSIISFARARFRDVGGLSGTTVTKPLLLDEEYQGFIDRLGTQEGLAIAAESLAASYAQKIQSYGEAGGIDIVWPKRPEFYLQLRDSIRKYGVDGGVTGSLYAGAPALPTPLTDDRLKLDPYC